MEFTHSATLSQAGSESVTEFAITGIEKSLWASTIQLKKISARLDALANRVFGPIPPIGADKEDSKEDSEEDSEEESDNMLGRLEASTAQITRLMERLDVSADRLVKLT